jgi:hypothetical protein
MPVLDHINSADEQPLERKDQERKHVHDGFANICK